MTYHWKLATGHQLSIDNEGAQTVVSISFDNGGRQQRTSNSFTTGIWLSPPEITFDPTGAIVTITTTSGESIVKIDGNDIQMRGDVRNDNRSYSQSVSTSSSSTSNVEPIVPPGNINVNPTEPVSHRKFCTECGTSVKPTDKFCASCGQKLG
ncbi:zinc-ribbon domain-containing protein [Chamaesiphon sp. GL140_3_metabinner_50]|uniref:zinc-ribbon domain-containing protein n=1 Tax=Chamaesiphon sp. GL140_3_metabinner_50 TaxID=2970812 RepID=UPI0025E994C4|nr:zinc-ribbon domain-containing protein [Chamaesiphon sp. GL140_3_metabinner_50]